MFSPGSKRTLLVFIILGQLMFSASAEAASNSCVNSSLISYRGAVDVDLINQSDPGGLTYSPEVGVNCYPA